MKHLLSYGLNLRIPLKTFMKENKKWLDEQRVKKMSYLIIGLYIVVLKIVADVRGGGGQGKSEHIG